MKKFSSFIVAGMIAASSLFGVYSPTVSANSANQETVATNGWIYEKTTYECRAGDQYEIKHYYKFENGSKVTMKIERRTAIGFCMIQTLEFEE